MSVHWKTLSTCNTSTSFEDQEEMLENTLPKLLFLHWTRTPSTETEHNAHCHSAYRWQITSSQAREQSLLIFSSALPQAQPQQQTQWTGHFLLTLPAGGRATRGMCPSSNLSIAYHTTIKHEHVVSVRCTLLQPCPSYSSHLPTPSATDDQEADWWEKQAKQADGKRRCQNLIWPSAEQNIPKSLQNLHIINNFEREFIYENSLNPTQNIRVLNDEDYSIVVKFLSFKF